MQEPRPEPMKKGTSQHMFLKAENLTKRGEGNFNISGVSFSQRKLESVAVAGETGAGKSTLLKMIAGFVQPDGGMLSFEGGKIIGPEDQLVPGHPGIAYLSQQFELQKSLRVEQVLSYANTLTTRAAEALYRVCQIDHLRTRRTDQLSGGEKQRVAICRLLSSSPRLLLLDEPFSHLDMVHKNTLKAVIHDIGARLKITCMLVSHDPLDTLSWADKILVMKDGKIVQQGTPHALYHTPGDVYTAGLFGHYNLIEKEDFRTFSRIPAIRRYLARHKVDNIFLRPEQFKLVRVDGEGIRGRVERVLFFGGHYELHVRTPKCVINIRVMEGHGVNVGDTVRFSVASKQLWHL